ncbi:MAG TPA: fumarylacetoacetate hydrolase family protein [Terriglobia bacterium]|nr:fumarylacetoacetate hydrolase family protein [Terriglobia bacterium]
MKLVTYENANGRALGVVEGSSVVDVAEALEWGGLLPKPEAALRAAVEKLEAGDGPPLDMIDLISRGPEYLAALGQVTSAAASAAASEPGLLTPLARARLRAPIARPPKITCVGLNYADHAREQGIEPPETPVFFLKSVNTIIGPGDPVRLPPNTEQPDYEAELAVVIGKGGSRIPQERAWEHVAGYTLLNDVTARDMQHGDKQWFRGKSCDTFAPIGPWIVTADEIPDPHNLAISLTLNGETMQDSSTSNLIHRIDFLISYLSQSLTWEPGDLISTGTPPGVGVFRKPPVFIKAGDQMSVTVEGVGTLTNPVVGP